MSVETDIDFDCHIKKVAENFRMAVEKVKSHIKQNVSEF